MHESREPMVSCCNLRKTLRVLLQCILRSESPIMTREQLRTPPRHAHGDLTSLAPHERLLSSQSYHGGNTTLVPQLEKTHEMPLSSREEGLLFLHGLESNTESYLQNPQEVWLPVGHSMGSKRYPSRLERRVESFASPRDEA